MDTNVPMAIGARCGKNKFTGLIDEVRVHAIFASVNLLNFSI